MEDLEGSHVVFRGKHFRLPIGLAKYQLRYALTGFGLQGACAHYFFGKLIALSEMEIIFIIVNTVDRFVRLVQAP